MKYTNRARRTRCALRGSGASCCIRNTAHPSSENPGSSVHGNLPQCSAARHAGSVCSRISYHRTPPPRRRLVYNTGRRAPVERDSSGLRRSRPPKLIASTTHWH